MRFGRGLAALIITLSFAVSCAKSDLSEYPAPALSDEEGEESADLDLITPEVRARGLAVRSLGWTEPDYTPEQERQIMEIYQYMDPEKEIPEKLRRRALLFYHRNLGLIPQKNWLIVADLSPHSRKYRLFLLNMMTGAVGSMRTSHGKGSDQNNDGYAEGFGNERNSNKSSLGFFLTGETYTGKHGYSLRIDGLSESNSMARERAVVIHGANYVVERDVKQGRSLGCFVVAWENRRYLINRVKGGALLYAGLSRG